MYLLLVMRLTRRYKFSSVRAKARGFIVGVIWVGSECPVMESRTAPEKM